MAISNLISRLHRFDGEGMYPFCDRATLKSVEGFHLNQAAFVDATLYAPGGKARQYMSKLTVKDGLLTVTVSDPGGVLCSGSTNLGAGNTQIKLTDTYGRICGLIIGNDDESMFAGGLKEGTFNFNVDSAEFVPTVVAPQPQVNLGGVLLEDGSFLSGDVWLVGKDGVVLKYNAADNTIYVHIVGDPLFRRRNCEAEGDVFAAPVPLQRLRFIMQDFGDAAFDLVPDEFGNTVITPGSNQASDNIFRVEPLHFGLRLRALGNVIDVNGQATKSLTIHYVR